MRRHILWIAPFVLLLWFCGPNPTTPVTPSPTPVPTPTVVPSTCPSPASCPSVLRQKVSLRECHDVRKGESCLVDTTTFFVGGRCNTEDSGGCPPNECGVRRECEPPAFPGPELVIVSGGSNFDRVERNDANGYQFRFINVTGRIKFCAQWPEGTRSQAGDVLDLSLQRCEVAVIEPLEGN